jgi:hypothetical protein
MRIGCSTNPTYIKKILKKIPRDEIPKKKKHKETSGVIRVGRKGKNEKRRKNMMSTKG